MSRREVSVELDEVLDRVWARTAEKNIDPDEATTLAYEELKAARAERRAKNAS